MIKKGQIILTVTESKRLISRAIVQHPIIKKALRDGIVVVHPSSTTYFMLEELEAKLPPENKGLWICGHISQKGLCLSMPIVKLLMGEYGEYKDQQGGSNYPFDLVFKKGVLQKPGNLIDVLKQMGENDVYVKAVNSIHPDGKLGILLCAPGGGSIGSVIRNKSKQGYKVLAVTGLEKLVSASLKEAAHSCRSLDKVAGVKCSITALKADFFISEIEAFDILTGCKATQIACGGVDGMEGGSVFGLAGKENQLDKAWEIWQEIRGSKLPALPDFECKDCSFVLCSHSPKYNKAISDKFHGHKVVKG